MDADDVSSSSDDDEVKPLYNPLNLPMDWDGKPIPYWLYRLHGLSKSVRPVATPAHAVVVCRPAMNVSRPRRCVYGDRCAIAVGRTQYDCQICDEKYRGRKVFERHFTVSGAARCVVVPQRYLTARARACTR